MARKGNIGRVRSESLRAFGVNAGIVEEIRERYEADPSSVDSSWAMQFRDPSQADPQSPPEIESANDPQAELEQMHSALANQLADRHAGVLRMIHAYRSRGHRIACTDPLGGNSTYFPELDPAHYGFGTEDLDQPFIAGDLPGGSVQTLREILRRLRATYCRSVGVEFTHMQDLGRKAWVRQRIENCENSTELDTPQRMRILEKLAAAELFERFLHTRFLGQKRFSIEGSESLIPLLDTIVESAPGLGCRELVLGMTHRGRLNVLSNILGKSLESIFSEFEDSPLIDIPFGSGDVKYHKGFSKDRRVSSGEQIHLSLTANPSHLEAVDPVVEGRTRAKQIRSGDIRGEMVIPVLIHGDAAFSGQGIIAETLNLSNLAGYSTGGTIHVVVDNQIGFTTTPDEARSTLYCTDVAKMIQIPIFHVNGDDPEAVVHCVKIAMEYRHRFGEDVVIDLVCYRRHGHSEGDEPSFTQPLLYEKIRQQESVRKTYTKKLLQLNVLTSEDARRIEADLNNQLAHAVEVIESSPPEPDEPNEPSGPWTGYQRVSPDEEPETAVSLEQLSQVAERIGFVPSSFNLHPKLFPLMKRRQKAVADGEPIDWGMAEALAMGSLLVEGTPVRLSGQDSRRGTFSHRHAVLIDQETEEEYLPLDNLSDHQARFEAYDSLLSEAAVLGFEYGYSLSDPSTLTIWEAQFGDFANGAQVIIDQFISSAHVKWQRMSGLVMLLPHGYEGQGPEHSSARIERFLQSCADDSLQIVNCTTPAQYFHVLRRQMRRPYRSPLIIFTPKSLLRKASTMSRPEDLASGCFRSLIDDPLSREQPERVERIVLCSGKVYYDLLEERDRSFDDPGTVALVRLEEIYPWPQVELAAVFERYANVSSVVWCQEEPANMGAWTFVRDRLQAELRPTQKLIYAGRRANASTATGSMRI
ncbi:MAG: 2-oxoglutarate dehydrogenase E1 component, partial [Myxococcales bacterium]|nr:2-oxoglutarate dehydrogenase E1 component [Myxococcales bacterium]